MQKYVCTCVSEEAPFGQLNIKVNDRTSRKVSMVVWKGSFYPFIHPSIDPLTSANPKQTGPPSLHPPPPALQGGHQGIYRPGKRENPTSVSWVCFVV